MVFEARDAYVARMGFAGTSGVISFAERERERERERVLYVGFGCHAPIIYKFGIKDVEKRALHRDEWDRGVRAVIEQRFLRAATPPPVCLVIAKSR
jgi:hypothetical protein